MKGHLEERSCQQSEKFICQSCGLPCCEQATEILMRLPVSWLAQLEYPGIFWPCLCAAEYCVFCKVNVSVIVKPLWLVQRVCMCMVNAAVWELSVLLHCRCLGGSRSSHRYWFALPLETTVLSTEQAILVTSVQVLIFSGVSLNFFVTTGTDAC